MYNEIKSCTNKLLSYNIPFNNFYIKYLNNNDSEWGISHVLEGQYKTINIQSVRSIDLLTILLSRKYDIKSLYRYEHCVNMFGHPKKMMFVLNY